MTFLQALRRVLGIGRRAPPPPVPPAPIIPPPLPETEELAPISQTEPPPRPTLELMQDPPFVPPAPSVPTFWLEESLGMAGAMVPRWLVVAFGELGIQEIEGPASNVEIERYHATIDGDPSDDAIAWCSSFVAWCMVNSGLGLPIGITRAARSWRNARQLSSPRLGCVVVFWRVSPDDWRGHVAFFLHARDGLIWHLGGNQDNQVTVDCTPEKQLLGYYWPVGPIGLT